MPPPPPRRLQARERAAADEAADDDAYAISERYSALLLRSIDAHHMHTNRTTQSTHRLNPSIVQSQYPAQAGRGGCALGGLAWLGRVRRAKEGACVRCRERGKDEAGRRSSRSSSGSHVLLGTYGWDVWRGVLIVRWFGSRSSINQSSRWPPQARCRIS